VVQGHWTRWPIVFTELAALAENIVAAKHPEPAKAVSAVCPIVVGENRVASGGDPRRPARWLAVDPAPHGGRIAISEVDESRLSDLGESVPTLDFAETCAQAVDQSDPGDDREWCED